MSPLKPKQQISNLLFQTEQDLGDWLSQFELREQEWFVTAVMSNLKKSVPFAKICLA